MEKSDVECMECVECGKPFRKSNYTYFCSMRCAANWGDDEAHLQYLAASKAEEEAEKEKGTSYTRPPV